MKQSQLHHPVIMGCVSKALGHLGSLPLDPFQFLMFLNWWLKTEFSIPGEAFPVSNIEG